MSSAAQEDLQSYIAPPTDDPVILAQRRRLARFMVDATPGMRGELVEESLVDQARLSLRDVLGARELTLDAAAEARIDACTDLSALRRWHHQAIVAATVAEALR